MLLRERAPQDSGNGLLLPISRYDIADHLGLAVETVSRAMSALCRYGVISMISPRQLEFKATRLLMTGRTEARRYAVGDDGLPTSDVKCLGVLTKS